MSTEWIPYGRQSIDETDIAAVEEVLRSDWLTTGPAVDEFESALEDVTGAPTVAVSSGTAALHCAYAACLPTRGGEVITSPMTFVATAAAAIRAQSTVRFADVQDDTLNIDPSVVASMVDESTSAVTAIDFAGHPAELTELKALAHSVGAKFIEDASHSIGARYNGHPIGAVADLTTFSFHPVKTITTGEGGAVSSRDDELLRRARLFRSHGLTREPTRLRRPEEGGWHQEVIRLGLNYRMPDILAALGRSQIRKLNSFIARRQAIFDRYSTELADLDSIRLPTTRPGVRPAWHLYAIRIKDGRRRFVYERLQEQNIGVQVHYLPTHLHPAFEDMGYRRGMCPVAEAAYAELLSLPLYPALTDDQQSRVIDALRASLSG